jgi:hypothetical protein
MEPQNIENSQKILRKTNKIGGITLANFKAYYGFMLIKNIHNTGIKAEIANNRGKKRAQNTPIHL